MRKCLLKTNLWEFVSLLSDINCLTWLLDFRNNLSECFADNGIWLWSRNLLANRQSWELRLLMQTQCCVDCSDVCVRSQVCALWSFSHANRAAVPCFSVFWCARKVADLDLLVEARLLFFSWTRCCMHGWVFVPRKRFLKASKIFFSVFLGASSWNLFNSREMRGTTEFWTLCLTCCIVTNGKSCLYSSGYFSTSDVSNLVHFVEFIFLKGPLFRLWRISFLLTDQSLSGFFPYIREITIIKSNTVVVSLDFFFSQLWFQSNNGWVRDWQFAFFFLFSFYRFDKMWVWGNVHWNERSEVMIAQAVIWVC